ncbi:hypothetical protein G5V59_00310 [Nocardioides sp. W3-2-3]|uniref:hypothetical protein n=1 Tax=Nocardioides convexus TaxID=2712224 RepID=UPI0024187375|nr:hypothetical protein [Nocardioides convexus]NGZ99414.1 hypothetical protein [Nocardioides convexus]
MDEHPRRRRTRRTRGTGHDARGLGQRRSPLRAAAPHPPARPGGHARPHGRGPRRARRVAGSEGRVGGLRGRPPRPDPQRGPARAVRLAVHPDAGEDPATRACRAPPARAQPDHHGRARGRVSPSISSARSTPTPSGPASRHCSATSSTSSAGRATSYTAPHARTTPAPARGAAATPS